MCARRGRSAGQQINHSSTRTVCASGQPCYWRASAHEHDRSTVVLSHSHNNNQFSEPLSTQVGSSSCLAIRVQQYTTEVYKRLVLPPTRTSHIPLLRTDSHKVTCIMFSMEYFVVFSSLEVLSRVLLVCSCPVTPDDATCTHPTAAPQLPDCCLSVVRGNAAGLWVNNAGTGPLGTASTPAPSSAHQNSSIPQVLLRVRCNEYR